MKLLLSLLCLMGLFSHVSQAQDTPAKWLLLHNVVRAKVAVGPLLWNKTLENYAKNFSQSRSGDCELIHSQGPYGENIYWGQGEGVVDATAAMKAWSDDEIEFYDYKSNMCAEGQQCGHYTQIVWRNTKQVGCGMAICTDAENKVFITCNYYPPGNYEGERPY
ncbi:hypothetical protein ACHQM5_025294 [Ranunculus cassubicifolius]